MVARYTAVRKRLTITYLKRPVVDGPRLITEHGNDAMARQFNYLWCTMMADELFSWMGIIEHADEHDG
jgi:hypothetical protein